MKKIACFAYVKDGDDLWISHFKFNGLYKIDLASGDVVFMGRFLHYGEKESQIHSCAQKYGNQLYFFPQNADNVDIYDISTGEFCSVKLPVKDKVLQKVIVETFRYDDTCVMVPRFADIPLMILSLSDNKTIECINLSESNKRVKEDSKNLTLYACEVNHVIYFPIKDTNCIGSYDLDRREEKIYILSEIEKIVGDIKADGNDFWINADNGIYKWNPNTDMLKFICDCSSEKEGWIENFVMHGDMVICIPRWLNNIKIIDKKTLKQADIRIDTNSLHGNIDTPWRDIRGCFIWGNELVILPVRYKETIFLNLDSYQISLKEYASDECMFLLSSLSMKEENEDNLCEFLSYIDNGIYKKSECDKNTGDRIWEAIADNRSNK